ncbi:MAG: carboxypeptidase-like regulatory domain-containing protein [Actinomycetota bacterium]
MKGRVVDEHGRPIALASIDALYISGAPVYEMGYETRPDGTYIRAMGPGRYVIIVRAGLKYAEAKRKVTIHRRKTVILDLVMHPAES